MSEQKSTFALFFGTRSAFPSSLVKGARRQMQATLEKLGHKTLMLDEEATNFGAVETVAEGRIYARFLREHAGEFDGVIVSLPNFGDENGATAAMLDAGVPILIQAYPDEPDKMAPALRRDAFCGKLSVMDVFTQNGIKFTALKPHTVSPGCERFAANVDYFDRVCRVVKAIRRMRVGAIGARTTAFKTVRIDELTLQKYGVTTETFDLSQVFAMMKEVKEDALQAKMKTLQSMTDCSSVPAEAMDKLARLGAVLDQLVEENELDAVAVRCWLEMQEQLGISPCVLLGEMNERGRVAACEVDVGNAVAMRALKAASGQPAACLDWNNNYNDEDDKCILFHCGPVPMSMMQGKGKVTDHGILMNVLGKGRSFGCNVGRIKAGPFTFASMATKDGQGRFYVGTGQITGEPIAEDFFGCAGVAHIENLQDVLLHVGREGHRHHVSITSSHVADPLAEALGYYLDFDVALPQR